MIKKCHMIAYTTLIDAKRRAKDGAVVLIETLLNARIPFLIISENSAYDREMLAKQMVKLGFPLLKQERFYTSTLAAIDWIAKEYPQATRAAFIGGTGLYKELERAGFEKDYTHPSWLFLGLDKHATYEDYNYALQMIEKGAVPISLDGSRTHAVNSEKGIGAGAIAQMLSYASNKQMLAFGRPSVLTVASCLKYMGYEAKDVVMVGDDFALDIIPALRCKIDTVYVASERSLEETSINDKVHPKWIVDSLAGLLH